MKLCSHCNEPIVLPVYGTQEDMAFCCQGCLTVYNVIHQMGLDTYYSIKKNSGIFKRRSPVENNDTDFTYLDHASFLKDYSYKNDYAETVMEFYLEGIHCLACLWLIEKIADYISGVVCIRLEMNRSVAVVTLRNDGLFSDVAHEFYKLGYKPHALKKNQESKERKLKEERQLLLKIGVAGASSGNIMIYAVSIYSGSSEQFTHLFHSLTIFFALPVLIYSSLPFYKNAWNSLKNRTLNIDVPISLALIVGGIVGVVHFFQGIEENYFDSLTALVFLLLLSRYFLMKIQEKGLSMNDLHFNHMNESVLRAKNDEFTEFESVHTETIKPGDCLKIKTSELIPVDGQVIRGTSSLDNSLLSGESQAVRVSEGDLVYSGTLNLTQELIVKAIKVQDETRLGQILKTVESGWSLKSPVAKLTNLIAKYFVVAIIILSIVLFTYLYLTQGFDAAFKGALTLLIVTCPCALAIATPLSFYRSLSLAALNGIIIKSDETIEKISKVKNVFLDKTGTITHGKIKVELLSTLLPSSVSVHNIIFNLESGSKHPVARALKEFIGESGIPLQTLKVENYREILGVGVCGTIEGHFYQIQNNQILEDGHIIASFTLADSARPDSEKVISTLKKMGLSFTVLSGDKSDIVKKISAQVGLKDDDIRAELSPEEKSSIIEHTEASMMVGDGANDAIALKKAEVGVAVYGAMDISLKACDVYLSTSGLKPVEELIILSQETMKVIYRNLLLSILYNGLSVVATFMGIISPLVAAIIMPVSSLTVVVSTLMGTKKMRRLWK